MEDKVTQEKKVAEKSGNVTASNVRQGEKKKVGQSSNGNRKKRAKEGQPSEAVRRKKVDSSNSQGVEGRRERKRKVEGEKVPKKKEAPKSGQELRNNSDDFELFADDHVAESTAKKETVKKEAVKRRRQKRKGGTSGTSSNMKKVGIGVAAVIGVLAVIYLGIGFYFNSHFTFNTVINGQSFSMKTVEDVKKYIRTQVDGYSLKVDEINDVQETITGEEIDLQYVDDDQVEKALGKQNAFAWPVALFEKNHEQITINVSYDEKKLADKINTLQCITAADQTDSVSAYPKFDGNSFVIEPEIIGTKVNKEVLSQKIAEYITNFSDELNMQEEKCYILPKYTSDSQEVKAACDTMNKYTQASITYTMGSKTEVVDKTLISGWVTVDDQMNVTFNTDAVTQYMSEFGDKYDTVGTTRTITSPRGKTVEVSGGIYGWIIDEAAETQALIASIQNGEVVSREPAYEQTAASHDGPEWGQTYAEIDLTEQHMWYIKDGAVAFEADIVSGLPAGNRETPQGVDSILEMQQNKTLIGEDDPVTGQPIYETPVSYWMRITWSGIGFHDANWQPYFGGSLYLSNGSHGCINMAYNDAATLYTLLAIGTPVITHY